MPLDEGPAPPGTGTIRVVKVVMGGPGGETFTREERAVLDLADSLKDSYEEAMCDLLDRSKAGASVWSDLLGAALSEVNWHEIAQHMIEDVDKDEEEADEDA